MVQPASLRISATTALTRKRKSPDLDTICLSRLVWAGMVGVVVGAQGVPTSELCFGDVAENRWGCFGGVWDDSGCLWEVFVGVWGLSGDLIPERLFRIQNVFFFRF